MKKNIYTQLKTIENGMSDLLSAMSSLTHNKYSFRENHEDCWTPNCDVYISDEKLHVIIELAGVNKDSIHLESTDKSLLIKGKRDFKFPYNDVCYYYMEIETGYFEREIIFPDIRIDYEKPDVKFENGILIVTFAILGYQDYTVPIETE